jgi:hypothetical protein
MSTANPAAARLENVRRSIAMAPPHSVVNLHREDVLDLLALVLQMTTVRREGPD